jgi:WD40 repeat protein/serine/threonine protein kinase/tetratricopeptide (TPR) repeat protein
MSAPSDQVKAILDQAMEIDSPAERAAYLNQACTGVPKVREQIEALLQTRTGNSEQGQVIPLSETVDSQPGVPPGTLDNFVVASSLKADAIRVEETVGTCIGPYRLLQKLGEGGMGAVWVAQQSDPVKRRVALKVIKLGMDSAQILHRFEAERQALALMDHTNIAKVLDAGTTREGRPYFVMELVKGVPITKYCDELHLTLRERLELFIPVCQAIEHAHQKGIIHRDVKPSNVLVAIQDGRPVPKVIDFGVAKALHQRLTEQSLYTEIGQVVGTLEYMSPEQAELSALDVDTRADVYSLGVLLYELLTGTTPLDPKRLRQVAYSEIVRQIREAEPPKPSTRLAASKESLANLSLQRRTQPAQLVKAVRGELDWIVMRCLEKDRTRRYGAANGLMLDVERYLKDEPVEACPPSAGYRLRKFARRYRAALVVATSFVALLVVAALVSTALAVRATVAERQAQSKAIEASTQAQVAQMETKRADAAAQQAVDEANHARFQTALTSFHQGWSRAEQGDVVEGMFWMIEALERAPEAQAEFRSMVRANLPAWEEQLVRPAYVISCEPGTSVFCFSPDGKTLLARLSDGLSLQSRDATTGRPLGGRMTHDGLTTAAFSPDGRKVVSGGKDRSARLWDPSTGQPIGSPLMHQNIVSSVAFSPDGQKVLTASHDKTARVWDAGTCRPLGPPMTHPGPVYVACFSPDGNVIVTGSLEGAQRWDARTGNPLGPPLPHRWTVYALAFSPDGKLLLTGSGRDEGAAQLWDSASGHPLGSPVPHNGIVHQVAFSPDGAVALSIGGGDQRLRLWDTSSGQLLASPARLLGMYPSFHPDGRSILLTDEDKQISRVWNLGTGIFLPRLPDHDVGIRGARDAGAPATSRRYAYAAVSPDGTRVATHGVPRARLWDVATGQSIGPGFPQRWAGAGPVAFSPDGTKVALVSNNLEAGTWDCTIQLADAKSGRPLAPAIEPIDTVKALAFNPDGSLLATGDFSDGVQLWDATSGMPVGPRLQQANLVLALAFSPDGTKLAVGTTNDRGKNNSQVRLWDLTTGGPIGEPMKHPESVFYVAFSPDGRTLLSVSYDGMAWRWDARTTQSLGPPIPHPTGFQAAVFRGDSQAVLTGTKGGTVRLWDLSTGQPLSPPANRPSTLTALAFRPDGAAFAAGYADGVSRLWDVATARLIGPPLVQGGSVLAVAFLPDGQTLLSVDNSADIHAWKVPPPATGDVSQLKLRLQALTGMEFQSDQAIASVDPEAWRERLRQLPEPLGQAQPVRAEADAVRMDDALAHTAEASGSVFAALWHLDRLIACRPGESTLWVRRAFVHAAAGRFQAADENLARALKLGPVDACVDLLARRADAAMASERWEVALWALHHAITARPADWWLYVDRAEALDHLGQKLERNKDLVRAIEHGADSQYLAHAAREAERVGERTRAETLRDLAIERLEAKPNCHLLLELAADQVHRNRLEKASELVDRIIMRAETTRPNHLDAGLLWLYLGVAKLYRSTCAKLLASYGEKPSPMTAQALAWQSVLARDAVADPKIVIRLAETALAGASKEQRPQALTTLGAALYRAGRPAEGVARLEEGIRLGNGQGLPKDWAFLAMAYQALGNSQAARQWLRKLADRLPAAFWDGIELQLLQAEAEALIQGSRPATSPLVPPSSSR